MLNRKRKNNTLFYAERITKILNYCGYDFGEEEPIYAHTKVGQVVKSKMGYGIQEGEFIPYQTRREMERRNTHPSNTLNEICDEQKKINVNINKKMMMLR